MSEFFNLFSGLGTEMVKAIYERKQKEKEKEEEEEKERKRKLNDAQEKDMAKLQELKEAKAKSEKKEELRKAIDKVEKDNARKLQEEIKKVEERLKNRQEELLKEKNDDEDKRKSNSPHFDMIRNMFSDFFSSIINFFCIIIIVFFFMICLAGFIEMLSTPKSTESEMKPASEKETIKLNYIGADEITYPTSPEDFVKVKHPNGAYYFKYPKNFFKEGYYDEETESYTFITADGSIELNYYQTDPKSLGYIEDDKNDEEVPLKIAKFLLKKESKSFSNPYTYPPNEISKKGYASCVISGNLKNDNNQAYYICMACKEDIVYSLVFKYTTDGRSESEMYDNRTPISYVSQCLYRGWSISGTKQKMISYSEFQGE